jgi:hypothetical protein
VRRNRASGSNDDHHFDQVEGDGRQIVVRAGRVEGRRRSTSTTMRVFVAGFIDGPCPCRLLPPML